MLLCIGVTVSQFLSFNYYVMIKVIYALLLQHFIILYLSIDLSYWKALCLQMLCIAFHHVFFLRITLSISYKVGALTIKSLSFWLFGKDYVLSSLLKDCFAEDSILGLQGYLFICYFKYIIPTFHVLHDFC